MLVSALILGLLGSLHCVGMCGPIAFMLPVSRNQPVKQFFQITSYHLGRVLSYSIIGLLFGLLGKGFFLFGFQQQLSILVGVGMILFVLVPKIGSKLHQMHSPLQKVILRVKSALGKELKKQQNDTFFTLGFFNGLLPCGLVYMAVFGAIATGNAWKGSSYMALFGLGTIPLMTAVIYLKGIASAQLRKRVQNALPYVLVFMGILFVIRGLGLGIPYLSPATQVSILEAAPKGCH